MRYADIVIDNKSKATDNFYTYAFDENLMDIRKGSKVGVTFGRGKNIKDGYVFDVHESIEGKIKGLKYIESVSEDICLSPEIIDTCIWMRQRYLCQYIDGIRCFIPPGTPPKRKSNADVREHVDAIEITRTLNSEQTAAVKTLCEGICNCKHNIYLVQGVTGSGKTEVYMRAISECLAQGRNAIMMVPEISLTSQIISRFEQRFGSDSIAIMHSKLSRNRRYEEWQRIRSGNVRIVIGARSAIFAPLDNIGIVIMDEEHETTYKSDMTPKYETVEIAIKRSKEYNGIVVLGSATPSVVTRNRADRGIYKFIELKQRYNNIPLPSTNVVDMRQELRDGNRSMFSRRLYDNMHAVLKAGKQVILFLNRRGFSSFLSCRECGHVIRCPECGISLTYHKQMDKIICHYCGHTENVPDKCPECGSRFIKFMGSGTEKLQEETEQLFDGYVAERLDFDSIQRKGNLDQILKRFQKGKTNILIGTQIVAKGLDFNNVGLVGIMSADSALNIPDFRSPERTFQLITQASGRAGRGDEQGHVIIQTYEPDNYAVQDAARQDYEQFYRDEIKYRDCLGYPPFFDLIQLVLGGLDEAAVDIEAREWYDDLQDLLGEEAGSNIFKPQPAPMNKIKETYRYSMLIKSPMGSRGMFLGAIEHVRIRRSSLQDKVTVGIDINPYSFL